MAEPRVVVGLDLGATFSGFAFAETANPQNIYTFKEWSMPNEGSGKTSCKTQTSLYYVRNFRKSSGSSDPEFVAKDWGWGAQMQYIEALHTASEIRSQLASDSGSVSTEDQVITSTEVWPLESQQEVGYFVRTFLGDFNKETKDKTSLEAFNEEEQGRDKAEGKESGSRNRKGVKEKLKIIRNRLWKALRDTSTKIAPQDDDASKPLLKAQRVLEAETVCSLPPGVTMYRATVDYLGRIADFIIRHLQSRYGEHMSKREVQWCLTVPAIMDNNAKQHMRYCAERAGLVVGPYCPWEMVDAASPFPLLMPLEPDAVAAYCIKHWTHLVTRWKRGAEFLVVDVGGATVDIARVYATTTCGIRPHIAGPITQDACGGTFVDRKFMNFLSTKVGGCLPDLTKENPLAIASLLRKWEDLKRSFDGSLAGGFNFELPDKLASAWQRHEANGMQAGTGTTRKSYHEVKITMQEMLHIFDPVVDQILSFIQKHLSSTVHELIMVGGFSASPYFLKRVHQAFYKHDLVKEILCPPEPGSAICQGAVVLGVSQPDILSSMVRVSCKTYGFRVLREFEEHKDPTDLLVMVDGKAKCLNAFKVLVKSGAPVNVNQCVEVRVKPVCLGQGRMGVVLYSTYDPSPRYTSDPGVKEEGSFFLDISEDDQSLGIPCRLFVSFYFGRSYIQMNAKRENFGNTSQVLQGLNNIEFSYEYVQFLPWKLGEYF